MNERSARREQLMQTGITELTYCFEDIYHSAPKEFQKAVDLMTDEELEKFIDDNAGQLENGIVSGLCTDQHIVLKTCAEEIMNELPEVLGRSVLEIAKKGEYPCFDCPDAIGQTIPCEAMDRCVAICAYTDFVTAKQLAFKLLMEKNIYKDHIHGRCECNSEKKCLAGRYLANEIGPDEVIRLLTADEVIVKSGEAS